MFLSALKMQERMDWHNMKELSLKERIYRELDRQNTWVASTDIERIVTQETTYSASNGARRLRDLFTEGRVYREYRKINGKSLAFYRIKDIIWRPQDLKKLEEYVHQNLPASQLTLKLG